MASPGRSVVQLDGKRAVLSDGRAGVYDANGSCSECCSGIEVCFCGQSITVSSLPFTATNISFSDCDNCIDCDSLKTATLSLSCTEAAPSSTLTVSLTLWCGAVVIGTDSADIVLTGSNCVVDDTYNVIFFIGGCDYVVVLSNEAIDDCGCLTNNECLGLANSWTDNFDVMPGIPPIGHYNRRNLIVTPTEFIVQLKDAELDHISYGGGATTGNLACPSNNGTEQLVFEASLWIDQLRPNPNFIMTGQVEIPGFGIQLGSNDENLLHPNNQNLVVSVGASAVYSMPINMQQFYAVRITATVTTGFSLVTVDVDGIQKWTGSRSFSGAAWEPCTPIWLGVGYTEKPLNLSYLAPWVGPDDVFKVKNFHVSVV